MNDCASFSEFFCKREEPWRLSLRVMEQQYFGHGISVMK
jgi:hypothetical protein